jgi:hypothetical protein
MTCIDLEHKEKLLVQMLDGVHKHCGKRKCKRAKPGQIIGECYNSFDTQHAKNLHIYFITGLISVLD